MTDERRRFRAAMARQFEAESAEPAEEKLINPEVFLLLLIATCVGFVALSTLILPA